MFVEEMMGSENHAGSADPALGSAFFEEASLDGMEFSVDGEAFDGRDVGAFDLQDRNEAGVDKISVEEDRTSSAFAFTAALFGSGEVQVFAEYIEEALHRWGFDGSGFAVDGAFDDGHAMVSLKMGPAMAGLRSSVPESGILVMRSKMSSGRSGISLKARPVACSMALRIAGAGPSMG